MPKLFNREIELLFEKLQSRKPFSFSKFADGEWAVMIGKSIDNGEFSYDLDKNEKERERLVKAFTFVDDGYYIGVSCPCCAGVDHYNMLYNCPSPPERVTYANIFVNSNYPYYRDNFVPEYSNWDVHLVAHESSKVDQLPFEVEEFYPVGRSALENNFDTLELIRDKKLEGKLFLFACGPFGNVLAHQLWEDNKHNTYLDIGSTLNPWLESAGFERHYYMGDNPYSKMVCTWGNN